MHDGWMSYRPLPSSFAMLFIHSCDIQYMYVLPMYVIFFPDCSRVLAVSRFLVVLLFIEMHTHKEVDKGT